MEGELVTSTRYEPAGAGWSKGATIKFNSLTAALEHFYQHSDLADVPMLHYLHEKDPSMTYRLRGGTGNCAYLDLSDDEALNNKVCEIVSRYQVGFSVHPFSVSEDDETKIIDMNYEHALDALDHWLQSHCNVAPSTPADIRKALTSVAPPDYLVVESNKTGYRGDLHASVAERSILCVFGNKADYDDGHMRITVEQDDTEGKFYLWCQKGDTKPQEKAFYDLPTALRHASQELLQERPHTIVDFKPLGCSAEDMNKKFTAVLPNGNNCTVIASSAAAVYTAMMRHWPRQLEKISFEDMVAKGWLFPAPGDIKPGVKIHSKPQFTHALYDAGYNISSLRYGPSTTPLSNSCRLDATRLDPDQLEMVLDQMEELGGKYLFDRSSLRENLKEAIATARSSRPGEGKAAFITLEPHAKDGKRIRLATSPGEGGYTVYGFELFMDRAKSVTQQPETVGLS